MSWTQLAIQSNKFRVHNTVDVMVLFNAVGFDTYKDNDTITVFGNQDTDDTDMVDVILLKNGTVISSLNNEDVQTRVLGCTNMDISVDDVLHDKYEDLNLSEDDVEVITYTEYIQRELLDGERLILTLAGFEGRTSGTYNPFGSVEVITKENIYFKSLYNLESELGKEDNKSA